MIYTVTFSKPTSVKGKLLFALLSEWTANDIFFIEKISIPKRNRINFFLISVVDAYSYGLP